MREVRVKRAHGFTVAHHLHAYIYLVKYRQVNNFSRQPPLADISNIFIRSYLLIHFKILIC